MKILSCCPLGYYSRTLGKCYEYHGFVDDLRRMGHTVHHFEHGLEAAANREAMNDMFVSLARTGGYDLILVLMRKDEFLPEALDEARRHTVTAAWNTDDDWRWQDYSRHWAPHFTWMVTTYRHIYEANREAYSNLLLSQWGCAEVTDGLATPKDIPISFVGKIHGRRREQVERLRRNLGLQAWGRGVRPPMSAWQVFRRRIAWHVLRVRWEESSAELTGQADVEAVWNRSKVSFTPLEASHGDGLQIKGRCFDMGLSGTVMLCNRNPALHEFYEPGSEYVEFEGMDECVEKARWLLSHDGEREAIARRYYERTRAEHLWRHRFEDLFRDMGLEGAAT